MITVAVRQVAWSARPGTAKTAAAGAPTGAVNRILEGVREAPATPFASCGGQRNGEGQGINPAVHAAREGGLVTNAPLSVIPAKAGIHH